jgi:hypothetical protein
VTRAFDRQHTWPWRVPPSKADRLAVALQVCRHRPLRDQSTRRRGDNREQVLIAMGIDTNDVVQFVCKHPDRSSDS